MKYFVYIVIFSILNTVLGKYFEWPLTVQFMASVMFGGFLGFTKAIEDTNKEKER